MCCLNAKQLQENIWQPALAALSSDGMGWVLDSEQSCPGFHSLCVDFLGESF